MVPNDIEQQLTPGHQPAIGRNCLASALKVAGKVTTQPLDQSIGHLSVKRLETKAQRLKFR